MTASWRRYARFWGARVDDDVDQELAFHVEMRVREYIAVGMTESDARDAAERRFGNSGRIRDNCRTIGHRRQRHMQRAQTIDTLVQDLRYGVRTLLRQKGWTTVALVTMSLGIGASTAVFSAVNSLILHPSPYRDANRLAMVWRAEAKRSMMITPSKAMLDVLRAQTKVFEGLEEFAGNQMTMTGRGDAIDVGVSWIEPNLPAFAGVPLLRGRTFLPDEMIPGGRAAVIIGEDLWRQRFGESAGAIGARLLLNDKPYTIVGIAPSRLRLPQLGQIETSVWLPLIRDSSYSSGMVLARLRDGLTFDAAATQLKAAVAQIAQSEGSSQFQITLVRPADMVSFRESLYLLAGAVALLMLVSCANVAHLLLARGATRERELSVRAALGAGRWRLTRQLLTESSILAAAGCIGGVALGYAAVRALSVVRPDSLRALSRTQLDGRALSIAILMSVLAGLAFGCIGAFHAIRRTSADSLRESASSSAAPRTHRLRSLLVVTEMALSALLLVGAALLTRSVMNLQHIDHGFDSRNLYSMKIALPRERYATGLLRSAFIDRVADAVKHVPGVVAVTAANATPPAQGGIFFAPIEIEGGGSATPGSVMPMNFVSPNYFEVLGIALEGATFTPASVDNEEVIVNRGFAQKYWPGQSAVGRRFRFVAGKSQKPDADWRRIVGVAADVPSGSPGADRGAPFTYVPSDPKSASSQSVVAVRVRDGVDPSVALQQIVKSIDDRLAPPPVTTVDADLARTVATQRFTMILLTVFAVVAVLLSAIGLYGVIAYVVTQRTREIGIRVALGASPTNVAGAIVVRGLALSTVGLALGLIGSIWGSALIKSALFGVTGTDAASYAIAGGTLLAVSAAACLVPMRRAMRVDPAIAMRGEI